MFKKSLIVIMSIEKTDDLKIVYNLYFKNALYSLECFKDGSSSSDTNNYCYLDNLTEDEGEAELFLRKLVKGKAFPIHIKDVAEDYFC